MKKQLLYVCPLLLVAASAWGATCANTTLNNYTTSGFSCTLDGLTFSSFSYYAPTGLPTSSSIGVIPVNNNGTVGFDFTGPFVSGPGTSTDALLAYTITAGAGQTMTGDSVTLLSANASGTGAVAAITEGICTSTAAANGSCTGSYNMGVSDYGTHPPPDSPTASVTFTTGATVQTVTKNIITQGATSGPGSAAISEFENVTIVTGGGGGNPGGGPTPEPASMLSLGSGLILTSMLLRRKMRKS